MVNPETFRQLLSAPGKALPETLVTVALGNGFIVTAMLWGGFLAELIDRRFRRTIDYLLLLAGMSYVGIIHSASPDGEMYFRWLLTGVIREIPAQFAVAYLVLAALVFLLSRTRTAGGPDSRGHHAEHP